MKNNFIKQCFGLMGSPAGWLLKHPKGRSHFLQNL